MSLEKVQIQIYTPPGINYIFVTLGVVCSDIPYLIGIDVLDKKLLTAENVSNRLVKKK